jgi:hypothetical protein
MFLIYIQSSPLHIPPATEKYIPVFFVGQCRASRRGAGLSFMWPILWVDIMPYFRSYAFLNVFVTAVFDIFYTIFMLEVFVTADF